MNVLLKAAASQLGGYAVNNSVHVSFELLLAVSLFIGSTYFLVCVVHFNYNDVPTMEIGND